MPDLGDPKQVKKAKRKHRNRETIAREELAVILRQRQVRNFLWTLLEECGIHSILDPSESSRAVGFHDGERNIGNKIIAKVDAAVPHTYIKMYAENRKDENANE